ncbi:PREDICTED: Sjoegren syndrome nuclear autoantigen 1 [Thamnophis sirtalis]|uniref:Sjoegren syndrome nuclear autoantigen 1 n=1 Tax=Thamnophis sirtalis TaxID=35019 RepID=A0A6I9Z554_9SAUR|nr:PREDICTED: Sjoegren syndrome nuclear autoantigen 1 [Thamnophis sirtalis]
MAQQGTTLQGCNNELVKYMEELCMQKTEVDEQIAKLIADKTKIQNEIAMLTIQLESISESLLWKNAIQKKLDTILAEGIFAYDKILDSSKILLDVLKKEIENLDKLIALKKIFSESMSSSESD